VAAPPTARERPPRPARLAAIAAVFVANGLGGPSFLPRLPERQADLGLSDVGLGVVLVGLSLGALAASPVAGRAVGRLGSRAVVTAAGAAMAASLWTAGAAPTPVALFAALAVVGAADASMDIAMNANGAAFERRSGGSVMHRLHGAWSLGALAGAGLAAACAAAGVPVTAQLAAAGAAIAVAVLVARGRLVADDATGRPAPTDLVSGHVPSELASPGPQPARTAEAVAAGPGSLEASRTPRLDRSARHRRGRAALAVLAAATVGGALVEGAPFDWSALRLERLGAGPGAAALGLAAFTAGMLVGRLVGDHLTDRYGRVAVLRGGMALAAIGLAAGVVVDHAAVVGLGLVVAGAGASGFFPLAFSAAADLPGVAPGIGAATVSLAARLGFLVEPLIVGALAEVVGLRWTFALVAGVALVVAALAGRIVPPAPARQGREG
jgi:MFS family permease